MAASLPQNDIKTLGEGAIPRLLPVDAVCTLAPLCPQLSRSLAVLFVLPGCERSAGQRSIP